MMSFQIDQTAIDYAVEAALETYKREQVVPVALAFQRATGVSGVPEALEEMGCDVVRDPIDIVITGEWTVRVTPGMDQPLRISRSSIMDDLSFSDDGSPYLSGDWDEDQETYCNNLEVRIVN